MERESAGEKGSEAGPAARKKAGADLGLAVAESGKRVWEAEKRYLFRGNEPKDLLQIKGLCVKRRQKRTQKEPVFGVSEPKKRPNEGKKGPTKPNSGLEKENR